MLPTRRVHERRRPRNRESGFTLLELTIAIVILGLCFMYFLDQRTKAVDRVHEFTTERRVQALVREKLEEIVYGDEDERSGEFVGPPKMTWSAEFNAVFQSSENSLLECTLTAKWKDEADDDQEYQLSTRVFPPRESPLLDEASSVDGNDR